MSSTGQLEQVKEFRGKSGAECESFIKSVREAAWKEGKLRDALWMADFASLHFLGKALRWHSALPLDVRHDWFKQEMALLERWPPPADESDNEEAKGAIVPTPAAASLLSMQVMKSSDIGVMQFVPILGNENPMYITEPGPDGQCRITTEVSKAIRLRWDLSIDSGTRVLEWVGSGSKWLAIHWSVAKPSFARGSMILARLTVVDPDTLSPATSRAFGMEQQPFRTSVWKLSSEGRTTLVWKDGVKPIQLEVFRTDTHMYIVVDPEAYQRANRDEIRGRLVFQPI